MDGIDLQVFGSGLVSVESSVGLIWAEDEETLSWTCHEAITAEEAIITPRYDVSEDGVLLGLVPDLAQAREDDRALYRSTDGCNWSAVDGLDGLTLADAVFDPADSDHVLVSTANPGEPVTNGIWRSRDGGVSFAPVLLTEDRVFRTVQFSPGGLAWAAAVWTAADAAWVYTSPDGETWTEHEVPLRDLGGMIQLLDVVATSPTEPQTAWLVAGPYGNDALLRTTDGGESFEQIFEVSGDILDAAVDASGAVWLAVSGRDYYRADDGEHFAKVEAAPRGMGLTRSEERIWLTQDGGITGYIAAEIVDADIQPRFHLSALELRDCPPASHAGMICDPLWPALSERLPSFSSDTGEPAADTAEIDSGADPDAGREAPCGCGGKGSAALVLPLLALGLRRRHLRGPLL
jgi:hypothetical protein